MGSQARHSGGDLFQRQGRKVRTIHTDVKRQADPFQLPMTMTKQVPGALIGPVPYLHGVMAQDNHGRRFAAHG